MYPRNSASPPEIDLGQILLISDGTIQTTGASVRVKIGTGAWGAGAGTLSCDATSGIWTYVPTQAETNAGFFIVAVYKASCTALSKTVITSASPTVGYAGLDWSVITAPTTTVNLSGTTISTSQAVASVAGNVGGNVLGSVASVGTNGITAASLANDAITADKIAADAVAEIQSGLATASNLAIVAGYLDTEIAAIKAKTDTIPTFPANFASFSINASGFVTVVTNNDKTGYSLATAPPTSAAIADAVWDEIIAGHAITGSTGAALSAAGGSGDPWSTALPGAYAAGTAGYIIGTNLDEPVSSGGGGGGGSVVTLPSSVNQLSRVEGKEITAFINENLVISQSVYDSSLDPVDLSAFTLKFVIATKSETHVLTIADADIDITGTDSNTFTLTLPDTFTDTLGSYQYSLRIASTDVVLAHGPLLVRYAATE